MVSFAQARANARGKPDPMAARSAPHVSNARHTSPRGSAAAPAQSLGKGR
jgi:hypothetical protein